VPADYKGVSQVIISKDTITVKERTSGRGRDLTMSAEGLNP
jgi:hypothetical protein